MKKRTKIAAAAIALAAAIGGDNAEAGWGGIKVKIKPLGPYQQKAAAKILGASVGVPVAAGTTVATGNPYVGAGAGALVGHGVSNHAGKKWTGKGLRNWRNPHRW